MTEQAVLHSKMTFESKVEKNVRPFFLMFYKRISCKKHWLGVRGRDQAPIWRPWQGLTKPVIGIDRMFQCRVWWPQGRSHKKNPIQSMKKTYENHQFLAGSRSFDSWNLKYYQYSHPPKRWKQWIFTMISYFYYCNISICYYHCYYSYHPCLLFKYHHFLSIIIFIQMITTSHSIPFSTLIP